MNLPITQHVIRPGRPSIGQPHTADLGGQVHHRIIRASRRLSSLDRMLRGRINRFAKSDISMHFFRVENFVQQLIEIT